MLEFMGNCMNSWRRSKKPQIEVTVAMLGLDNSGKTVTSKTLQKVNTSDVTPTVGFESCEIQYDNAMITMFDLGGGSRIRDIWTNYLAEIHGLVYVVDSSTPERMDECRRTLTQLLTDHRVLGKPLLILANKQDIVGSLDEIDICEYLNLESLVNKVKCPCKVKMCSALPKIEKGKLDISISTGITWLLNTIRSSYEELNERREKDMKQQKNKESAERKARQERVKKLKDDKAKKEQQERELRGEINSTMPSSDDEDVFKDDDPFKRINTSTFKKKDESKPHRKSATSDEDIITRGRKDITFTKTPSLEHFSTSRSTLNESRDRGLTPITSRLEPLSSISDMRKGKKAKRNQTLPTSVDDTYSDQISAKLNSHVSFRARNKHANISELPNDFSSKWGIVDELPALASEA